VRVSARPSALGAVLRATEDRAGTLVGRAALGISFVELEPAAVDGLVATLPTGAHVVLLDAPGELRAQCDVWGAPTGAGGLELMRRVKARFDPAHVCNPGVYVGGI
jgi:hypothetical protein